MPNTINSFLLPVVPLVVIVELLLYEVGAFCCLGI
jgi:hypothetical protein